MYVSSHAQTLNGERYEVGDVIPDDVLSDVAAARLARFGWVEIRHDTDAPRPPARSAGKEKPA